MCCCPIQQDPREFHTLLHLNVGGWDHTEEVELEGTTERVSILSSPLTIAVGAQIYRTPRATGKTAHTTPSTQPSQIVSMETGIGAAVEPEPETPSSSKLRRP